MVVPEIHHRCRRRRRRRRRWCQARLLAGPNERTKIGTCDNRVRIGGDLCSTRRGFVTVL